MSVTPWQSTVSLTLIGSAPLSSPLGLETAVREVFPQYPAGAVFTEIRMAMEALIPQLKERGMSTTELAGILSRAGSTSDPIHLQEHLESLLQILPSFMQHRDNYVNAANAAAQNAGFHTQLPQNPVARKTYAQALAGREASFLSRQTGKSYEARYEESPRPIARGGQADVYAVYELGDEGARTGRRFIAWKPRDDGALLGTFYAYAKAAAQLDHPKIVKLRDVVATDTTLALIFDAAPGLSLDRHIAQGTHFTLTQLRSILSQLWSALDYAHGEGFLHRDLKPSNVMVDINSKTGEVDVTVLDFGIAKNLGLATGNSSVIRGAGTWNYKPFEAFLAEARLTPAYDIMGVGLILLDLLRNNREERSMPVFVHRPTDEIARLRLDYADQPEALNLLHEIEAMTQENPQVRDWERPLPVALAAESTSQELEDLGRDIDTSYLSAMIGAIGFLFSGIVIPSLEWSTVGMGVFGFLLSVGIPWRYYKLTNRIKTTKKILAEQSAQTPALREEFPPTSAPAPRMKALPEPQFSSSGPGCFLGNAFLKTERGNLITLSALYALQQENLPLPKIAGRHNETGQTIFQVPSAVIFRPQHETALHYLSLATDNDGVFQLPVTKRHPFLVDRGVETLWPAAEDLKENDSLVGEGTQRYGYRASVSQIETGAFDVFNLSFSGDAQHPNFLVSPDGHHWVVAHNIMMK